MHPAPLPAASGPAAPSVTVAARPRRRAPTTLRLLPVLAGGPGRARLARIGASLAVAALVVLFGFDGLAAPADARWALAEAGVWPWDLAAAAGSDLLVLGYPIEAVATLPLAMLGGAWVPVACALWLAFGGVTAGWLGGRWWGSVGASVGTGLAWELVCAGAVVDGEPAVLVTLALLPLAWGLFVRALDRGDGASTVLAGAAAAGVLAAAEPGARWLLVLYVPTLAVALRGAAPARAVAAALGTAGVALVLAAAPLAGRIEYGSVALATPTGLPAWLAGAAVLGAWRARARLPRLFVPALALVAALGPTDAHPAAALALALLAGGALAGATRAGPLPHAIGRRLPSAVTTWLGGPPAKV